MENQLSINSTTRLNDGREIPLLGLGVYLSPPGDVTKNAVLAALAAGYRHIDTASLYRNEADVGEAVLTRPPREEIFVTTKIWNSDQGYEKTLTAADLSLARLKTDYIDLLLLHSPVPGKKKRLESYRALEELVKSGKVKSIGVSNYGIHHLRELFETHPEIKPAVNQIEVHPWCRRQELTDFCEANSIVVEAYSPLAKAQRLDDANLVSLAQKHNKTSAQILVRWGLQHGFVSLPKSTNKERIKSNADVFNFHLDDADMEVLDSLDENFVTGWDPTTCD